MSGKCQFNIFCFQKMPTAIYSILLNLSVNFEFVGRVFFKRLLNYIIKIACLLRLFKVLLFCCC